MCHKGGPRVRRCCPRGRMAASGEGSAAMWLVSKMLINVVSIIKSHNSSHFGSCGACCSSCCAPVCVRQCRRLALNLDITSLLGRRPIRCSAGCRREVKKTQLPDDYIHTTHTHTHTHTHTPTHTTLQCITSAGGPFLALQIAIPSHKLTRTSRQFPLPPRLTRHVLQGFVQITQNAGCRWKCLCDGCHFLFLQLYYRL